MSAQEKHEDTLSRRNFLAKAGILTAGFVTTGLVGIGSIANADTTVPTGSTQASGSSVDQAPANQSQSAAGGAGPVAVPLKYGELDVELVRRRGYDGYYKNACCYGAASALLTTLNESAPDAGWNTIPSQMFIYGGGGALSWGTLCGALNGSLAVLNLASAKYSDLGNELIGWYTKTAFPSNKHEDYCLIHNQVTSVSDSPLCHVSVSRWAAAAGEDDGRISDAGKKDRCAKLTGDVAAKAAELLNQALDGTFKATYQAPETAAFCLSCHSGKTSMLDNEQGKMDCAICHTDL